MKKEETTSTDEIRKRFREVILKKYGKQESAAHHLGYDKATISRCCSGKQPITDAMISKVSKKCGVSEDYIRCLTKYKTNDEYFLSLCGEYAKKAQCKHEYINSLGYKLQPCVCLLCPGETFKSFEKEVDAYVLNAQFADKQKGYHAKSCVINDGRKYSIEKHEYFFREVINYPARLELIKKNFVSVFLLREDAVIEALSNYLGFYNCDECEDIVKCDSSTPLIDIGDVFDTFEAIFNCYALYDKQEFCGFFHEDKIDRLIKEIDSHAKICCSNLIDNNYHPTPAN